MKDKILLLGVTGMLGSRLFRFLSDRDPGGQVFGTCRAQGGNSAHKNIIPGMTAENPEGFQKLIETLKPTVVINCIGLIKQLKEASDPVKAITLNALFPHQIHAYSKAVGARLIHISTDCVFSGKKGNYSEADTPDATDLYGKTKALGEVIDAKDALTIRTSIIGHELKTQYGLLEWFLSQAQAGKVRGYTHAIFSGFPTRELSKIIADVIIPNPALHGLYHVSSQPISKFDLLKQVAAQYQIKIEIEPSDQVRENRSLDSTRFREITKYLPPSWETLVREMSKDKEIYDEK